MFESIVKRAENAVGDAVARASGNLIAAVPMVIAFGFATAAGAYWADETLGPLAGNLAVACVFLALSLVAFAYTRGRAAQKRARAEEELAAQSAASPFGAVTRAFQSPNVMLSLYDMAKDAAPGAAKNIANAALRAAPRNLPLLLGAGLGLMVASRLVDAFTNGRGR